MSSAKPNLTKTVLSAMFLALALVLPFLTGQIPQIGGALCPMHIPALLCGFFCGPVCGAAVGFIAPLLRFALFGMPPIMPTGIAMSFELAAYGAASGLLYAVLPKKKIFVYISLICSMLIGRGVWGAAMIILQGLGKCTFGAKAFFAGAFVNAIPGMIVQIILVPVLVMAINRAYPDTVSVNKERFSDKNAAGQQGDSI